MLLIFLFPSSLTVLAYCLNPLKAKVRERFGSLLKVHIQGQAEASTGGRVAVVRRGRGSVGVGRHLTGSSFSSCQCCHPPPILSLLRDFS